MSNIRLVPEAGMDSSGALMHDQQDQQEVLRRAVAKVVALGEQVGVSPDQMILLLDAGMTVKELLEFLVNRKTDPATDGR
ncbi:MAG: hypothetical protein WCC04_07680 [Terriglobales bacterium]